MKGQRTARYNQLRMKADAKMYLKLQYQGLREYEKDYPQYSSLINMKKDRIKGACDILVAIGLLDYDDINRIAENK